MIVKSYEEYVELANLGPATRAAVWELINLHHPEVAAALDELKADKHYRDLFAHFGAHVLLQRKETHPDIINLIEKTRLDVVPNVENHFHNPSFHPSLGSGVKQKYYRMQTLRFCR